MSLRDMLSPAVEDYLKAIFILQSDAPVSTSGLATRLGVSPASVTNMVKRLSSLSLVTYKSYKGVRLTDAGEAIALEIIRHHRLLETYLREVMGYDWEEMHREAEHLEHHISEAFEERLDHMLGYPTHDPHGDPIPARDGTLVPVDADPLPDFPEGSSLIVRRVADTDIPTLKRLDTMGLLPGAEIRLVEVDRSSDTVILEQDDAPISLPISLAEHVFVSEHQAVSNGSGQNTPSTS